MEIISVCEYEKKLKLSFLSHYLNKDEQIISKKLKSYGAKFQSNLGLSKNPINIEKNYVVFKGIAGTFNLFNKIQIDIVPKYIQTDTNQESDWKKDFFYLTLYSKYHLIMNHNKVFWGMSKDLNFQKLIVKTFINLFKNKRSPLVKKYTKHTFYDFAIDGEIDEESVYFPSEHGFKQSISILDYNNYFNYVIKNATEILLNICEDTADKNSLTEILQNIKIKKNLHYEINKSISLPSRYAPLKPLFDLATDICLNYNFQGQLSDKQNKSFAFIVHTWRVWEDFLSYFLKKNVDSGWCEIQKKHILGTRTLLKTGLSKPLNTKPDIIWHLHTNKIVIDAKYKNLEKSSGKIIESDLYESIAFSLSTNTPFVILLYPDNPSNTEIGNLTITENISINHINILAVTVNINGISSKDGFNQFKTTFIKELHHTIASYFDIEYYE